jgi:tetratricopeptide (TPR) repeat protein
MDSAYELFRNGTRLLEDGDFHAAAVPLARARELEPDKASIREALGRALFGSRRYSEAAEEFGRVVEHAPTNDSALGLPPVPRPGAAQGRGVGRPQAAGSGACGRRCLRGRPHRGGEERTRSGPTDRGERRA